MSAFAANGSYPASAVTARSARVARVQTQDIEHISEVQTHSCHGKHNLQQHEVLNQADWKVRQQSQQHGMRAWSSLGQPCGIGTAARAASDPRGCGRSCTGCAA